MWTDSHFNGCLQSARQQSTPHCIRIHFAQCYHHYESADTLKALLKGTHAIARPSNVACNSSACCNVKLCYSSHDIATAQHVVSPYGGPIAQHAISCTLIQNSRMDGSMWASNKKTTELVGKPAAVKCATFNWYRCNRELLGLLIQWHLLTISKFTYDKEGSVLLLLVRG